MAAEDLPWEAQMNCHRNIYVTFCLNNWSDPSNLVLLIPATKASIAIDGVTIRRKFAWCRLYPSQLAVLNYTNIVVNRSLASFLKP